MCKYIKTTVLTIVVIGVLVIPTRADIYRFIDSNGVLHFTNMSVSSGYELFIKEKPVVSRKFLATNKYDTYIHQASKKYGIAFNLLKALIKVESNFDPRAVSRKGAKGLMQIMPENFKRLKIKDPFNPWQNIMGGAKYLKTLLKRFDGKLPLALAAYNAGPGKVEKYRNIPPYLETEEYVNRVIKYYHILKKTRMQH